MSDKEIIKKKEAGIWRNFYDFWGVKMSVYLLKFDAFLVKINYIPFPFLFPFSTPFHAPSS